MLNDHLKYSKNACSSYEIETLNTDIDTDTM